MLELTPITHQNLEMLGSVHYTAWCASHKDIASPEFLAARNPKIHTEIFFNELKNEHIEIYLAYLGKTPIGMLSLNRRPIKTHPNSGEIRAIYLLPEYCGKEYGKQIMDFAVERLHTKSSIFLWVMNVNQSARRFYEKYGFIKGREKKLLSKERGIYELRYVYHPHDWYV